MIVTSNLIQTPKVFKIDQNRWSRSVKFTGQDLLKWVFTVDQNTHSGENSRLILSASSKNFSTSEKFPCIAFNRQFDGAMGAQISKPTCE